MSLAAVENLCTFRDGILCESVDLGDGVLVDKRADVALGVMTRADFELLHRLHKRCRKAIVDARLHEDAIGANAGLSGVAILRGHGARDCLIEVGIVENEEWGIAAQLQRQLLHCVGALTI